MSYINHANMWDYRVTIRQFESGETAVPDVTNHPFRTTTKYGFGANLEQSLNGWLTAFGRFGRNEGRQESFFLYQGQPGCDIRDRCEWKKMASRTGSRWCCIFLERDFWDHRLYVVLGGKGFLLGDGDLN